MVPKGKKKTAPLAAHAASRLVALIVVICFSFVSLVAYSFYVQHENKEQLSKSGNNRTVRAVKTPALRGTITDRNGAVLAVSSYVKIPRFSPQEIYRPRRNGDPINWQTISDQQFAGLARILKLPEDEIRSKFKDIRQSNLEFRDANNRKIVLNLEEADELKALKIPTLHFDEKMVRTYPTGNLFSHIVGFRNEDLKNSEGIERLKDDELLGIDGRQIVLKDGRQNVIEFIDSPENQVAQTGQTVVLSIDESLQRLAYDELAKALQHFNAKAGAVVVLDAQNGEILAMSSLPDYDANSIGAYPTENRRNYAVSALIEPGSVMKPFVVAKALDDGKVGRYTWFDTKPYKIGNKVIRDTHDYPSLDVEGILQKSSNVGITKIANLYENNQELYDFYRSVGLGRLTHAGVFGEQSQMIKPAQKWGKMDKAAISYGYGITVNLLQLAQGYTIFTTNGRLLPATIYKRDTPVQGVPVIKPETARQMREMMMSITEQGGTGLSGAIEGYDVAAKTGTARKSVNGRYEGKYRASFVGFAPAHHPRLIVAVVIDEPSGNGFYGGTVAGPVFREVMAGGLKLLGVKPTYYVKEQQLTVAQ